MAVKTINWLEILVNITPITHYKKYAVRKQSKHLKGNNSFANLYQPWHKHIHAQYILQDVAKLTLENQDSTVELGGTLCLLQESRYLAPKIKNLGVSNTLKYRTAISEWQRPLETPMNNTQFGYQLSILRKWGYEVQPCLIKERIDQKEGFINRRLKVHVSLIPFSNYHIELG